MDSWSWGAETIAAAAADAAAGEAEMGPVEVVAAVETAGVVGEASAEASVEERRMVHLVTMT